MVTDFGLARRLDQHEEARLTQEGAILGPPAYMAPEQVTGDPNRVGPACDVYSLGVILYELLTGQVPYRGSITASAFCRKLGELPQEQAVHLGYRLPSEAEWEYACRSGTTTTGYGTDDEAAFEQQAWIKPNAQQTTHPVRQKTSNAWGLYDLHGNVLEMCADWYDKNYYAGSPSDDPKGPSSGSERVLRGGAGGSAPGACRSAVRWRDSPGARRDYLGFRVAADLNNK